MAEPAKPAYQDNPEVLHESSDVSVKGILLFGGILAITTLVIHLALYGLLVYYERPATPPSAALRLPRVEEAPPDPRLRVTPRADLAAMRNTEEHVLQSYGWVDREKNIVRVPIERAMEALVKKGLPARKQTEPQAAKAAPGKQASPKDGALR